MCAEMGRLQRGQVVDPIRCNASRSSAIPHPGQWTLIPSGGRDGVMRWSRGVAGGVRLPAAEPMASVDLGVA